MKEIFKNHLFNHGILVCEESEVSLEESFTVRYMLSQTYGIRVVHGKDLATKDMIPYVANRLGKNVPEPFYRGFPDSVRKLSPDALLFDQLLHYFRTYELGDFSERGHSVMEEKAERLIFDEKYETKDFKILKEKEAAVLLEKYIDELMAGTRPLNEEQYRFVRDYLVDYPYKIKNCASKNLAIKLLLDTRDMQFTKFITISDVIKLVDELNYRKYNNKNIRKLNLKNQDRKFITKVMNCLFEAERCDTRTCFEKKAVWSGLLHHIHYKPVNKVAVEFVQSMRGKENNSVFSAFETAIAKGDIQTAVIALKSEKGNGVLLRNLNYIISRCQTDEDIDFVLEHIEAKNGIILLQLLLKYAQPEEEAAHPRTFKFTKHNKLVTHTEMYQDVIKRKSFLNNDTTQKLYDWIVYKLNEHYHGKLGKVYIDPSMRKIALPLQENTSSSGYGMLPKGSRIPIGKGKKIRAFTYWEQVNDIDLSVTGIDRQGIQSEFSWRTMANRQSAAITYSGDETSGYDGGSEYFDIDVEKFKEEYPAAKYLVFCNNVYSRKKFIECICRAGYMLRDKKDTGEIYEPKTVQTSFTIDCDSTFAYLFAIDIDTNEFIWLNVASGKNVHVAGTTEFLFLKPYINIISTMNMEKFFSMLATEVVENYDEADVIVSDADITPNESQELIRSCDFERIIQLINM